VTVKSVERKLVNLTSHNISLVHRDGSIETIPSSGVIARVAAKQNVLYILNELPVMETKWGAIVGLPEPEEGVTYITSTIVAMVAKRDDLVCPNTSPAMGVREDGKITAVKGFQAFK